MTARQSLRGLYRLESGTRASRHRRALLQKSCTPRPADHDRAVLRHYCAANRGAGIFARGNFLARSDSLTSANMTVLWRRASALL